MDLDVPFDAWHRLVEAMTSFAQECERLPALMAECGVDASVIEQRRPEIERLSRQLLRVAGP
jgi:hypothetical protein